MQPAADPASARPKSVLDASALLALAHGEDGERVVARLRPRTRAQGLSLADRACLALTSRLGVPALTADRTWAEADTGAEVQLIR